MQLVEGNLVRTFFLLVRRRVHVQQALDALTTHQMLRHDLIDIARFDLHVEHILREYFNDRPFFAETKAAGHGNVNFLFQTIVFDGLLEFLQNLLAIRSVAAGTAANQHHAGIGSDLRPQAQSQQVFVLLVNVS